MSTRQPVHGRATWVVRPGGWEWTAGGGRRAADVDASCHRRRACIRGSSPHSRWLRAPSCGAAEKVVPCANAAASGPQLFFLSDSAERGVILLEDVSVELQAGNVSVANSDDVMKTLREVGLTLCLPQPVGSCPCVQGMLSQYP